MCIAGPVYSKSVVAMIPIRPIQFQIPYDAWQGKVSKQCTGAQLPRLVRVMDLGKAVSCCNFSLHWGGHERQTEHFGDATPCTHSLLLHAMPQCGGLNL